MWRGSGRTAPPQRGRFFGTSGPRRLRGKRSQDLLDRPVRQHPEFGVGAILNRVGDKHPGRVGAEGAGLGGGRLNELR